MKNQKRYLYLDNEETSCKGVMPKMDSTKIFLNPTRMRVLQYLLTHTEATSNEIIEYIQDIPRTTMYRHLKLLEDNGVITVVRENRIRGTLEKVYSLNLNYQANQTVAETANAFFLGLLADFQTYIAQENQDMKKDMLLFQTSTLMASDEEYTAFLTAIAELLKGLMNNPVTPEPKIFRGVLSNEGKQITQSCLFSEESQAPFSLKQSQNWI